MLVMCGRTDMLNEFLERLESILQLMFAQQQQQHVRCPDFLISSLLLVKALRVPCLTTFIAAVS
jgi:hypothetical protein